MIKKKKLILVCILFIVLLSYALAADTTAPVTTSDANALWNTRTTVTFTCSDSETGCKDLNYSLNSGIWNNTTYSLSNFIDISQTASTSSPAYAGNTIAQQFLPTKTTITGVNAYLSLYNGSGALTKAYIQKDNGANAPDGNTIVTSSWYDYTGSNTYFEFYFTKTTLSIIDKYWIIFYNDLWSVNVTPSHGNPYPNGVLRRASTNESDADMVFQTYYDSNVSPITINVSDGNNLIQFKSTDNNNNLESIKTAYHAIDTVNPITTDNASNSWSDSNETITLTPSDTTSGIANTYYCVDTAGTCIPTTSGTSVTVGCVTGSVCQQYIRYFSKDNAGNIESTKTSVLTRIDKTKPVTTFSGCDGNWTNLTKIVTLSPSDVGSGLALTQYRINLGAWTTYSTTLTFSTDGNYKIDYNSTDLVNNKETMNTNYCLIDKTNPTMDFNIITNTSNALDQNIRIKLTCYDNLSSTLNKTLNKYVGVTATTIYNVNDANALLKDINYTITGTNQFFRATCTDLASNSITTDSNTIYSAILNLVNEVTGAAITLSDLNSFLIKKVYTTNGNFVLDLNTSPATTFTFIGLAKPLIFEFTYSPANTPIVTRYIDVSISTDLNSSDLNIRVCVPVSPPLVAGNFAQQRLVSNQSRSVSVRNMVANCYALLGDLVYAYDTGYAQTFWTVNKPYELKTYYLGVATVLSQLDGSVSYSYNLDTLLFSRSTVTLAIGADTIAVAPKINPLTNNPDLNIVEIVYHAFQQDNTLLNLKIYNGSELLVDYTESITPDDLIYEFYYPSYPTVTDTNFLRAVFTSTRTDGTSKTTEIYFSITGEQIMNKIDYSFAAIVSVLFFLFGISLTSASRTLGLFGIMICLISIAITAFALQYWWVQFLMVGYIICLIYMIIIGKQSGGGLF